MIEALDMLSHKLIVFFSEQLNYILILILLMQGIVRWHYLSLAFRKLVNTGVFTTHQ